MRPKPDFFVSQRAVLRQLVAELRGLVADREAVIARQRADLEAAARRQTELTAALARKGFEDAKARGCYGGCITPFMGRAEAEAAWARRQGLVNRGRGDGQEAR